MIVVSILAKIITAIIGVFLKLLSKITLKAFKSLIYTKVVVMALNVVKGMIKQLASKIVNMVLDGPVRYMVMNKYSKSWDSFWKQLLQKSGKVKKFDDLANEVKNSKGGTVIAAVDRNNNIIGDNVKVIAGDYMEKSWDDYLRKEDGSIFVEL